MNKLFDNPAAFDPMFDDIVKVAAVRQLGTGTKTVSGSFRACVMPISNDDPFAEQDVQSDRQKFSVMIPIVGNDAWMEAAIGTKPQIGDIIELTDGTKTAVTKVAPLVDTWFELEVRAC